MWRERNVAVSLSPMSARHNNSGPNWADHGVSALNAWLGDFLQRTENPLAQPMAFFANNQPVAPEALAAPSQGRVCVLVHGLGCNESVWTYPKDHGAGDYGSQLEEDFGFTPLYVRYNTGLRVSENGQSLCNLLNAYAEAYGSALREVVIVAHSMGGLVTRSACHLGEQAQQAWVKCVRQVVYLGAPHLGAPLEKFTNVATHVLGQFDTTATRVIRDVLNSRSTGIKDLRYGNLLDEDWLNFDPDALLQNTRVPVPWLATARHHRVVGSLAGPLGDAVVRQDSAAGAAQGDQPGAPETDLDRVVLDGFDHLALARHPDVYNCIRGWVDNDER